MKHVKQIPLSSGIQAMRWALSLMPLSSLLGSLCLLGAMLSRRAPSSRSAPKTRSQSKIPGQRLFLCFLGLSLLPLFWLVDPLAHLGGLLAHYVLPALILRWFYRQLQHGRFFQPALLQAFLLGSGLLAFIGFCNGFLHWHGQWSFFRLLWYDQPALLNLDLPLHPDGRAQSFAMHPNILGALMLVSLPFWLLPLSHVRLKQQFWLLAGLSLSLLTLGLSFSRAAWCVALPVLLLAGFWLLSVSWRWTLIFVALIAGIIPALLMGWGAKIGQYALSVLNPEFGSNYVRLELWQSVLKMITDHPFWGIGQLHFVRTYPQYQSYPEVLGHAHNWYLQVALESGIPLACLFFMALFKLWGTPQSLSQQGRAAWLLVFSLLLISCVDIALLDWRVSWLGALALAYIAYDREQQQLQASIRQRFQPEQFLAKDSDKSSDKPVNIFDHFHLKNTVDH